MHKAGVAPWLLVGVLGIAGCADLLGLRSSNLEGPCTQNTDCAPGSTCIETQCLRSSCEAGDAPRCSGLTVQECTDEGTWTSHETPCSELCVSGACVPAPSCTRNLSCEGDISCCYSIEVPSREFSLTYYVNSDDRSRGEREALSVQRHVGHFALDKFEVTVGRFREFFAAFDEAKALLVDGAGAPYLHPELGWQSAWNEDVTLVPGSADSLSRTVIGAQDLGARNIDPRLPVHAVPWYLAFAFCIWDQGRLPTESEWALAATGGEQREYPWPNDDGLPKISAARARYASDDDAKTGPSPVGTHHDGAGAWGHEDLAGNVAEWLSDLYVAELQATCSSDDTTDRHATDCVTSGVGWQRALRGGSYISEPIRLTNANRSGADARGALPSIGFRCARDLR